MARNVSRRGFIQGLAALGAGAKTGALGQMAGKALEGAAPAAAEAIARPVSNDMVMAIANKIPQFNHWADVALPKHLQEELEGQNFEWPRAVYEKFVRDAAADWNADVGETPHSGAAITEADINHFLRTVPEDQIGAYTMHHDAASAAIDDGREKEAWRFFAPGYGLEDQLKYDIPGMTPEQIELMHDHSGLRPMLEDLHTTASEAAEIYGWPKPGEVEAHSAGDYASNFKQLLDAGSPDQALQYLAERGINPTDVLRHLFPDEAERLAVAEKLTTAPQITDQRAVPMEPARDPVPVKRQEDE